MGDLRSQLLKAGLVTEKKLKEVEADFERFQAQVETAGEATCLLSPTNCSK